MPINPFWRCTGAFSAACWLLGLSLLAGCGNSALPTGAVGTATTPGLKVLSNRSDLLSGGDAYVEILVPASTEMSSLRVDVDGRDVSAQFARRSNGRILGVVTGLPLGRSQLRVRSASGHGSRVALKNHAISGPVFAGPHLKPWVCGTEAAGLGPASDAQCNAPTQFALHYKSAVTGLFVAYDANNPPADLAQTTTDRGNTVPYIVRVEKGVINRGIYELAVLFDPTAEDYQPWAPQAGWNGKIMWLFGGGTAPRYTQDPSPTALDDNALSRGFMVATQGLNVHGSNSNDNLSAEALMMLKEHIVETYGEIRYTIGEGCSGGGLQQYLIANSYPGLIDGLIPSCSFPDVWTTAIEVSDCSLLYAFFNASPLWPVPQQALVEGHSTNTTCIQWQMLLAPVFQPDNAANCNLPAAEVYHSTSNPNGARCTLSDHQKAVLGERPPAVWGPVEQARGKGFAQRPLSNVGVQYGLLAFQQGLITAQQFVDLNTQIGGIDIDGRPTPTRTEPDPGVMALGFRAGLFNDARHLARVPIIDLRGHDDVEIHTDDWSYVIRARLDRAHGHHDNHVIFTGAVPLVGDPAFSCSLGLAAALGPGVSAPATPAALCTANPLLLMDQWLAAMEADTSSTPLEQKVRRHKPAAAVDTCFVGGAAITDTAVCAAAFPYYANPRVAAGMPFSTDIPHCQLKPLAANDYLPAVLTSTQLDALRQAFPNGVCDWSQRDAAETPSLPWLDFSAGPGGQPLGADPVATVF